MQPQKKQKDPFVEWCTPGAPFLLQGRAAAGWYGNFITEGRMPTYETLDWRFIGSELIVVQGPFSIQSQRGKTGRTPEEPESEEYSEDPFPGPKGKLPLYPYRGLPALLRGGGGFCGPGERHGRYFLCGAGW